MKLIDKLRRNTIVNLRQLFSDNVLFFVYTECKHLSRQETQSQSAISKLRLSFVRAAGYALQFIIMKIVCEVDCLEDNESIIYGSYAR